MGFAKAKIALRLEFKFMVVANALFIIVYLLWDWAEYSLLNGMSQVTVDVHFPWYAMFDGTKVGQDVYGVIDTNWGLAILLLAALVNLYFAFRLQQKAK